MLSTIHITTTPLPLSKKNINPNTFTKQATNMNTIAIEQHITEVEKIYCAVLLSCILKK